MTASQQQDSDGLDPAAMLSPRGLSAWVGMAVFGLGFAAMNVFRLADPGPSGLPGLYDYRAATLGDGILLPLMAYALTRAAGLQGTFRRRQLIPILFVACLAAVIGAGTQVQWWVSASTPLNWTIPRSHHFTLAGWYHAAFLTLTAALLAGLGTAVWQRLRSDSSAVRRRVQVPGALAVTTPSLTFAGLLALDNFVGTRRLNAGDAIVPAAGLFGLLILLLWAIGWKRWRPVLLLCSASALPAGLFCVMFWPGLTARNNSLLMLACASALVPALCVNLGPKHWAQRIGPMLLVGTCFCAPLWAATARDDVSGLTLFCGFAAASAGALVEWVALGQLIPQYRNARLNTLRVEGASVIVGLGAAGVYFSANPQDITSYSAFVGGLAPGLTLLLVPPWVGQIFRPVIRAEDPRIPQAVLASRKWSAYPALIGIAVSAMIALMIFSAGTSGAADFARGRETSWATIVISAVLLAGCCLALELLRRLAGHVVGTMRVALAVSIPMAVWSFWEIVRVVRDWQFEPLQALIVLILVIVSVLFVWEGIRANLALIHNCLVSAPIEIVAVASGTVAGATTLELLTASLGGHNAPVDWKTSPISLALDGAAIILLPFLGGRLLSQPPKIYTPATPLQGVVQDAFISFLLVGFIGWFPILILVHLRSGASWVVIIAAYLGFLASAYVYIMRNNVQHFRKQVQYYAEEAKSKGVEIPEDRQHALQALRQHLWRQNALSIAALLPLVPLALATLAGEQGGFEARPGVGALLSDLLVDKLSLGDPAKN